MTAASATAMLLFSVPAAAKSLKQLPKFTVADGECGEKPNCVSTLDERPKRHMLPWPYKGKKIAAFQRLERMAEGDPQAQIAYSDGLEYLHVVFKSKLWKFADDVEFWLPDQEAVVHFRSASRKGHWDFGANKKRMKRLEKRFEETP